MWLSLELLHDPGINVKSMHMEKEKSRISVQIKVLFENTGGLRLELYSRSEMKNIISIQEHGFNPKYIHVHKHVMR